MISREILRWASRSYGPSCGSQIISSPAIVLGIKVLLTYVMCVVYTFVAPVHFEQQMLNKLGEEDR
jgi:uncharacterized membrane protein (DUF485 family)